jgi:DNA-directed RNA polymerase specialized sigma24 family protein
MAQTADIIDVVADRIEHATFRETLGELHWREQRELLLLASGFSYAEIMQITGTTYTAVNRWLAVVPREVVHPELLGGWWLSRPQHQGVPDEASR